jgi:hypothetical protein
MTRSSWPAAHNAWHRTVPMAPAPPVTTAGPAGLSAVMRTSGDAWKHI